MAQASTERLSEGGRRGAEAKYRDRQPAYPPYLIWTKKECVICHHERTMPKRDSVCGQCLAMKAYDTELRGTHRRLLSA